MPRRHEPERERVQDWLPLEPEQELVLPPRRPGPQRTPQYQRTRLGLGLHYARLVCLLVSLFCSLGVVVLLTEPLGRAVVAAYALAAALAVAAAGLGAAGSVLCCWVPPSSGARGLIRASLTSDVGAFLLGGVCVMLTAAHLVGLAAPLLFLVGAQLVAGLFGLAALGLFLLFLGKLARSRRQRDLAGEAASILTHLGYLGASVVIGLFLLGPLAAACAHAGRSPVVGGAPLFGLAVLLRVLRGSSGFVGRFEALNRTTLSYMLSHEHDERPPVPTVPTWVWLVPVAAAVPVLAAFSGSSLILGAGVFTGAVIVLAIAGWLVFRTLSVVGALLTGLPRDGGDPWEAVRTLPAWLWFAPPAALTLILATALGVLAAGRPGGAARVADHRAAPNPAPPARPSAPPTNFAGLVAYWSFDDPRPADRVADRSGNGNDGKAVGATSGPGVQGQALEFTNHAYFDYGAGPALNFPANGGFTIACWLRTTSGEGTVFAQRHSRDDGAQIHLRLAGGRLRADVRQDGGGLAASLLGPHSVADGRWHHVALLRSGRTIELYVDGNRVAEGSGDEAAGPITTDLRAVGRERRWAAQGLTDMRVYFTGAVDEMCVFNRALNPDEIQALAGR